MNHQFERLARYEAGPALGERASDGISKIKIIKLDFTLF